MFFPPAPRLSFPVKIRSQHVEHWILRLLHCSIAQDRLNICLSWGGSKQAHLWSKTVLQFHTTLEQTNSLGIELMSSKSQASHLNGPGTLSEGGSFVKDRSGLRPGCLAKANNKHQLAICIDLPDVLAQKSPCVSQITMLDPSCPDPLGTPYSTPQWLRV